MSFLKFCFCGVLSVLILKTDASKASSDKFQTNNPIEETKEIPANGANKMNLDVHTNFKGKVATWREVIKAEFAQQRVELQRQKEDLTSIIEEELTEYKAAMEKYMKNQLQSLEKKGNNEAEIVYSTKWDKNLNCTENCDSVMGLPRSCEDAMATASSKDGVYLLNIENKGLKPFYAYCQRIDNKVWTVMQRREDGSVSFFRNWEDYKHGFGNLYGEFWLGLERLNKLTEGHPHELHVWMEARNGTTAYAHYKQFSIANETEKYRLSISGYSGNAGDSLIRGHNGMQFSTFDNDNDLSEDKSIGNCAMTYHGAWWFEDCYNSHLNGRYHSITQDNFEWVFVFNSTLKSARMAIRKV